MPPFPGQPTAADESQVQATGLADPGPQAPAAGARAHPLALSTTEHQDAWQQFTPQCIDNARCLARTWNHSFGGQCHKLRDKDTDLCTGCANGKLTHGRIDGPIPAKKLCEFQRWASKRNSAGAPAESKMASDPTPQALSSKGSLDEGETTAAASVVSLPLPDIATTRAAAPEALATATGSGDRSPTPVGRKLSWGEAIPSDRSAKPTATRPESNPGASKKKPKPRQMGSARASSSNAAADTATISQGILWRPSSKSNADVQTSRGVVSGFGDERCEDVDAQRRTRDREALSRAATRSDEGQRGRARDILDRDLDRSAGSAWRAGR